MARLASSHQALTPLRERATFVRCHQVTLTHTSEFHTAVCVGWDRAFCFFAIQFDGQNAGKLGENC